MKTSNKLLIILAIALFVIPIGGMVIHAKMNRMDKKEYETAMKVEAENPDAVDRFLVSKKVGNFNKVVIEGNGKLFSDITVVKSEKSLVKFDKRNESLFTTSVDKDGVLYIKADPNKDFAANSIYLFVPHINSIEVKDLQVGMLETNFDSLSIVASKINNGFNFGENKNLKSLSLEIKDSQISLDKSYRTESWLTGLKNLHIKVINGGIGLSSNDYKDVQLNLQNANFNFIGKREENENSVASISKLVINSIGKVDINLPKESVQIGNLSGALSDSTVTNLPYFMTKDLYKN